MELLPAKVLLTPALIALATLVGRRWGPGVGGWLVGLPLTSGPVALFLALDHGTGFAASAASGSLVGASAEAVFCLGYLGAVGRGPRVAVAAASVAFVVASAALLPATGLPALLVAGLTIAILVAVVRLLPDPARSGVRPEPPPWDLPARMIAGGAIVVLLTAIAPILGPEVSGIAAAFPVFASVLTVFAHHESGSAAALRVLRGLVLGLFAFTTFFLVIGLSIVPAGVVAAFLAAGLAALVVQGLSLRLVRTTGSPPRVPTGNSSYLGVGQ